MEESYSPVGELRDVMVAFNGEDHAKTYAVDEVDYERFKAALLDDSKAWAEIKKKHEAGYYSGDTDIQDKAID